jgi:hypothetical protein
VFREPIFMNSRNLYLLETPHGGKVAAKRYGMTEARWARIASFLADAA